VTEDDYRAVDSREHTLRAYACGVRAGDRLRLKRDLAILDHEGRPSGQVIPAGSIWRVLPGNPEQPDVVWLQEPGGNPHTWDEDLFAHFERVD
jgi:hypothetical protein